MPAYRYTCFLSHNWGKNAANHERVAQVHEALKNAKLNPWFDEVEMHGDVKARMCDGIDESECVLVFITGDYLLKAAGKGPNGEDDNCKFEFDYASKRKGVKRMITVLMEATSSDGSSLYDGSNWAGAVGACLGSHIYVDMTKMDVKSDFKKSMAKLVEAIARVTGHSGASKMEKESPKKTKKLLVIGECGDGKSTLVSALRDPELSQDAPTTGKKAAGVTKHITEYVGKRINGHNILLLDTPGVGDGDVTVTSLIARLEDKLSVSDGYDKIDGVIVTTPVSDGRVKLGARVVKALVDKGFVGEAKWKSIILCGTKADKAEDDDKECFVNDVVPYFFNAAGEGGAGEYAMTSREDYEGLCEAIAKLPAVKVDYSAPDAEVMSDSLAELTGIDKKAFQEDMMQQRQRIELMSEQLTMLLAKQEEDAKARLVSRKIRDEERRRDEEEKALLRAQLEEQRAEKREAELAIEKTLAMNARLLQQHSPGIQLTQVEPPLSPKSPRGGLTGSVQLDVELDVDAPPGGHLQHEKYFGPKIFWLGLCFFSIFTGLIYRWCTLDQRQVYIAPDGSRFPDPKKPSRVKRFLFLELLYIGAVVGIIVGTTSSQDNSYAYEG